MILLRFLCASKAHFTFCALFRTRAQAHKAILEKLSDITGERSIHSHAELKWV